MLPPEKNTLGEVGGRKRGRAGRCPSERRVAILQKSRETVRETLFTAQRWGVASEEAPPEKEKGH